jgi:hypothetical protein
MAGFNGIAHPADGMVELAVRLGRQVQVTPSCCSIAVGEEILGSGDTSGLQVDLEQLLMRERSRKKVFPIRKVSSHA